MLVLGMMARPGSEFHVAQLSPLTADRGLVKRDGKFVMEPLDESDQPSTHHPVDRRDRTLFHNIDQGLPLRIVQPRAWAGSLAVQKSIGCEGIEP